MNATTTQRPRAERCRHGHLYDEANTYLWTNPKTGKTRRSCRACVKASSERHHQTGEWRRRYGITPADYEAMLEAQGGTCAICDGPPSPRYQAFDVDHDHVTGRVRGLLCRLCNIGVAHLEREGFLGSALVYLNRGGEGS